MKLLVTSSLPRTDLTKLVEGQKFSSGRIDLLDWETKECTACFHYASPPEHLGQEGDMRFTGGCPYNGKWYQTTGTELLILSLPDFSIERVISHPSFHDLHGVSVVGDEIAICNTGLEMIQFLDHSGAIVREVELASTPTWQRFDRQQDYRQVATTKPHEVHVNHVFQIDQRWWATRCISKDAVRLDNPEDRIDIAAGQPHDGIVRGDKVYFSTTCAKLIIADTYTRRVDEVIDLNMLEGLHGRLGWCRGLEVEGDYAWVAFSRMRYTKWAGTFRTAKDVLKGRKRNSQIIQVDLRRKRLVDEYDYTSQASSALFTLMNYDRVRGLIQ